MIDSEVLNWVLLAVQSMEMWKWNSPTNPIFPAMKRPVTNKLNAITSLHFFASNKFLLQINLIKNTFKIIILFKKKTKLIPQTHRYWVESVDFPPSKFLWAMKGHWKLFLQWLKSGYIANRFVPTMAVMRMLLTESWLSNEQKNCHIKWIINVCFVTKPLLIAFEIEICIHYRTYYRFTHLNRNIIAAY